MGSDPATHEDHVELLRSSLLELIGRDLLDFDGAVTDCALAAKDAPFALLSHDTATEPVFTYGNRKALELFELEWAAFTRLPSRGSAEPVRQEERQRLLDRVTEFGFTDDYSDVRISATGRRFTIHDATVWNLTEAAGRCRGQAAMFGSRSPLTV